MANPIDRLRDRLSSARADFDGKLADDAEKKRLSDPHAVCQGFADGQMVVRLLDGTTARKDYISNGATRIGQPVTVRGSTADSMPRVNREVATTTTVETATLRYVYGVVSDDPTKMDLYIGGAKASSEKAPTQIEKNRNFTTPDGPASWQSYAYIDNGKGGKWYLNTYEIYRQTYTATGLRDQTFTVRRSDKLGEIWRVDYTRTIDPALGSAISVVNAHNGFWSFNFEGVQGSDPNSNDTLYVFEDGSTYELRLALGRFPEGTPYAFPVGRPTGTVLVFSATGDQSLVYDGLGSPTPWGICTVSDGCTFLPTSELGENWSGVSNVDRVDFVSVNKLYQFENFSRVDEFATQARVKTEVLQFSQQFQQQKKININVYGIPANHRDTATRYDWSFSKN